MKVFIILMMMLVIITAQGLLEPVEEIVGDLEEIVEELGSGLIAIFSEVGEDDLNQLLGQL